MVREERHPAVHLYYSGKNKTQIDKIVVRKAQWRYMMDTKVIPSEKVAPQDKPVAATLRFEMFGRKDLCSTETRIRSGKRNGVVI